MSIGFLVAEDQAVSLPALLLRSALMQLLVDTSWGPLDYLIVDLPPGTLDIHRELFELLELRGAIVVVTPQDLAHLDARRVLDVLGAAGVDVIGGVENMAAVACPHCGETVDVFPSVRPERSIWNRGVARLASIPLDPAVAHAAERGRPVFLTQPDGPQARA